MLRQDSGARVPNRVETAARESHRRGRAFRARVGGLSPRSGRAKMRREREHEGTPMKIRIEYCVQ
jgi:hypothetical protein